MYTTVHYCSVLIISKTVLFHSKFLLLWHHQMYSDWMCLDTWWCKQRPTCGGILSRTLLTTMTDQDGLLTLLLLLLPPSTGRLTDCDRMKNRTIKKGRVVFERCSCNSSFSLLVHCEWWEWLHHYLIASIKS